MNKKYRLFGKIPVVDLLIVLLLITVLAGAVWILTRSAVQEETGRESQIKEYPFTATFLISQIGGGNENLAAVGDALYQENGTYVGKATDLSVEPSIRYAYDSSTGKQVGTVLPDHKNLYITVEGKATSSSNAGTFIGKSRLSLGNSFRLSNGKFTWSARVVALNVEETK